MYFTRSLRLQFSRAYSSVGGGSENAYKILGLQKDCSPEKVRAAFRELAKATHPDTQPGRSEASSSSHFVRVLAAYQILADPRKRALYDAQLAAREEAQNKQEFYQWQRYRTRDHFKRRKSVDQQVDQSEAEGDSADHHARVNEPERQEFVCPETEVVEWLKGYRSAVTSAVHRREIGVGGGLMEGVRGELGSALRKAYHGPPVYEENGIPVCFEAEERAEPHVGTDILQLVSGHNLFGFVRAHQQPTLEDFQCRVRVIDGTTRVNASEFKTEHSHVNFSNHNTLGHQVHSHAMHNDREDTGNEAVESEYVDLELHLFGKVVARASRVQPKVDGCSTDGLRPTDCIYVYSIAAQENLKASEDKSRTLNSAPNLLGTIHGLGDVNPRLVCAVHGPDGKLTHKIVQHRSPLVKHMTWFKEGGSCECRCRRASLLPSRYWIFAPRSATHNIGGWYIESWNTQVRHVKYHSGESGDKYGVISSTDQGNLSKIDPAMYIFATAYKTLDEEAAKRRKFSKFIEFSTMISTVMLWCRSKFKVS